MKKKWDEQTVRRVAAEAMVDRRTMRRFLAGEELRKLSRARIERAAKKLKVK